MWHNYIEATEQSLAAIGSAGKVAGEAAVGFEILAPGSPSDDFASLRRHVADAMRDADGYFSSTMDYGFRFDGDQLWLPVSTIPGPGEGRAYLFEARKREAAVVLLPHWNASRTSYRTFARMLANCGITCLQLSLPYHDERQTPGVGFARELACENLGLTIQSNSQAIIEARACLSWLERRGYERLGIVGVSIGSSIGSIAAALDSRVRSIVLLLMADDFADVVWTGSATQHVKSSLARRFTLEEVRAVWSIISPATYAQRLASAGKEILIVSGERDHVFTRDLTHRYVDRLLGHGISPSWTRLNCGHYTLGIVPYSAWALLSTVTHLKRTL